MLGVFRKTSIRSKYLTNLSHYLIGFAILVKGYAKLENHPDQISKILFIFFAGIFIIFGAAFHSRIEKKIKNFTALFYIAEGAALISIGFIYMEEGSARVSYFLFFIGIVYFAIGLTFFFVKEERKELAQNRLQLWIGIAFLAAALVAFVLNQIYDNNIWINILSIVLSAAGLIMIIKRIFNKKMRIFST
jgi:peptidoglycan/LPS O-acetylase OafA/YrhL